MGFAAIARVTDNQWVTCTTKDSISFGLKPGDVLEIETTICNEVRKTKEPVFIDNVKKDDVYSNHHSSKLYEFQSYVSVPIIRKDGSFFGTLCAIDPKPAKVNTPEITGMFELFSDLISFHLNAIEELNASTAELKEERYNSELREQFIAILGHDLRNPLATTRMAADILMKISKDEIVKRQAGTIKSTSYRMAGLIDNMLDFARGRLGEGIIISRNPCRETLHKILEQVVKETEIMTPGRSIDLELDLKESINCDENRIGQLFSNLLGNAVLHGSAEHPIRIFASSQNGEFVLSVTNCGEKIADSAKPHLFQPFYREKIKPGKEGLGLGLFITSEIAKAHGGEMEIKSTDEETCFTFRMPLE